MTPALDPYGIRLALGARSLAAIRRLLLKWAHHNLRDFPWRETANPFHVLIAESLLRKTQAQAVVGVYEHLVRKYPTPAHLAKANPAHLLKLVRPLGLNRRALLLRDAARALMTDHDGNVPSSFSGLLKLPGVGKYGAHVVLAFAFGRRVPIVDSGIARVLGRITGYEPKEPAYLDKWIWEFTERLLPRRQHRLFLLGLLDLAATVCRPKPRCAECPLKLHCKTGRNNLGIT